MVEQVVEGYWCYCNDGASPPVGWGNDGGAGAVYGGGGGGGGGGAGASSWST